MTGRDRKDCLLTAAVELGRSCASLASGGRNAEALAKIIDCKGIVKEATDPQHLHKNVRPCASRQNRGGRA